jgi:4-oxalomesaconate tautomerase
VTRKVVPKMTMVAPPREGGAVCTRTFIPHVCHDAIGVLGAVSVATACVLDGSAAAPVATIPEGATKILSIEHPTGEFTVQLETRRGPNGTEVTRAALLRTARRLFEGSVLVPRAIWDRRDTAPERQVRLA